MPFSVPMDFKGLVMFLCNIQDLLALKEEYTTRPAAEETINDPTNPKHYWRYRMCSLLFHTVHQLVCFMFVFVSDFKLFQFSFDPFSIVNGGFPITQGYTLRWSPCSRIKILSLRSKVQFVEVEDRTLLQTKLKQVLIWRSSPLPMGNRKFTQ